MKTLEILRHRAVLCVLLIVAANAYLLRHELAGGRFELNDSVFHYTLADRTVQAIETGENPMDWWVSEWTFGYPVPRTYPMLSLRHGNENLRGDRLPAAHWFFKAIRKKPYDG